MSDSSNFHLVLYRGETEPTCDCGAREHAFRKLGVIESRTDYNERYRKAHTQTKMCECGAIIKELSQYAHLKSKKHNGWLISQQKA
jgi:hypothetical protein